VLQSSHRDQDVLDPASREAGHGRDTGPGRRCATGRSSRPRSVIGSEFQTGRGALGLDLPIDAWIDLEAAEAAIHQAESAIQRARWHDAWVPSHIALNVSRRPLLAGLDAPLARRTSKASRRDQAEGA
jgi:hypothetical protein